MFEDDEFAQEMQKLLASMDSEPSPAPILEEKYGLVMCVVRFT